MSLAVGRGVDYTGYPYGGYAQTPSSSVFVIPSTFTLMTWFKPDMLNPPVTTYLIQNNNNYAILWNYVANTLEFYSGNFSGSDPRAGSQIALSDTNPHFVTYTYDGTTFRGYLDGVLKISNQIAFTLTGNSQGPVLIGAPQNHYPINGCYGSLWDTSIWNIAIGTSKIQKAMTYGLQGTEDGLVGYWPANEGVGTVVNDHTPNGNNATLNGQYRWIQSRTFEPKNILSFDGVNAYTSIPSSSLLSPQATGHMTLEAWVYPRSTRTSATNWLIAKGSSGANDWEYGLGLNGVSPTVTFTIWQPGGANYASSGTNSSIPLNQWTHIVGVLDGTQCSCYVNGSLAITNTGTSGSVSAGTDPLFIGKRSDGYNTESDIAEVRIYNRALSASEVFDNFSGTVTRSGLVGEWLFNEGSGTVAKDSTANHNDGTISGATWVTGPPRAASAFGNNLVLNPSFETDISNTNYYGSGVVRVQANDGAPGWGTHSFETQIASSPAGGWFSTVNLQQANGAPPPIVAGRTYTVSFWFKNLPGSSSSSYSAEISDGGSQMAVIQGGVPITSTVGEWLFFSKTFVALQWCDEPELHFRTTLGGTGNSFYFRVDGVQLYEVASTPIR